jgi:hypothetical protein
VGQKGGTWKEALPRESFERVQNFLLGYCESKSLITKPKIELWYAPRNIMIENNENMYPQQQAPISLYVL